LLVVLLCVALAACQREDAAPPAVDDQGAFVATTSTRSNTTSRSGASTTAKTADGIEGFPVDPAALVVGDCFNRYSGLQNYQTIEIVTRRPCEQPHDAEVFYKNDFAGSVTVNTYPGKEKLTNDSIRVCYANFEAFVGKAYETSSYQLGYFVPPLELWEATTGRSRAVTCYVTNYAKGTKLTGTVRNSRI
jgi:hypothetical protein